MKMQLLTLTLPLFSPPLFSTLLLPLFLPSLVFSVVSCDACPESYPVITSSFVTVARGSDDQADFAIVLVQGLDGGSEPGRVVDLDFSTWWTIREFLLCNKALSELLLDDGTELGI
jgi:hypothetical protein